MGILDTIKKAFGMLPALAGSVGQLALVVTVLATVIGVFVYQIVTAGSVSVDGTYNSTADTGTGSLGVIGTTPGDFSGIVTTIWSSATSVTGFIVLGVIALIAFGILGKKFLGGGKSNI